LNSKKDRLLHICRALAAKTTANGCTEDEAIAAAAKLAALLAEHNISMDEVQLRESEILRHTERFADGIGERLWKLADGAAHMTGCRYWVSPVGVVPLEVNFFGFDHEVSVARYLLDICAFAMRSERDRLKKRFALLRPEFRRARIIPYLDGMADSLRKRLRALKPPTPTGTGLIVLRGALIDAALKDAGIKLGDRSTRASRNFEVAYRAGLEAGERVPLNPGLAGSHNAPRIGG